MSDTPNEQPTEQPHDAPKGGQEEPKSYSEDYVKKLRDEAANYRTKLREAEESKVDAQKLQDELNSAKEERDTLSGELGGYKQRDQIQQWSKEITKDSHIPADVLRGSTQEELQGHFEQLKSLVPLNDQKPRHVLSGEGESTPLALNGDGIESALKGALGI